MNVRKIISTLLLVAGVIITADFFYPQIGETIRSWYLKSAIKKQISQISHSNQSEENVLGEEEKKESEIIYQEIVDQLKNIPATIAKQEIVQEISQKVTETVNHKYEEIKDMPQQQIEQTKKEVKKQIYQEICGEWLKDNE